MCQTPPLPGNDVFEPGDLAFYLGGQLESRRLEDYRAGVRTDYARQTRFIHRDDVFIIGPQGATYGCCQTGNCPCPRPAAGPAINPQLIPVTNPGPEAIPTPMPSPGPAFALPAEANPTPSQGRY
jgi:hypothetical protein